MSLKSDSTSCRKTLQNSHNSVQRLVVSVLCQETKKHRNQKLGSKGTPKLGPCWKLRLVVSKVNMGVEIRIKSLSEDNSHSWVRISQSLNKLVTNLNNNEQETSEVQFEEYALRLNASDFPSRTMTNAKRQRRESASSSTRTFLSGERIWTGVEPGEYSISDFEVSKKLIHLLRNGSLPRENDGAIEFWKSQTIFRNISCIVIIGLTTSGRKAWQEEEETRKETSIVLIRQE